MLLTSNEKTIGLSNNVLQARVFAIISQKSKLERKSMNNRINSIQNHKQLIYSLKKITIRNVHNYGRQLLGRKRHCSLRIIRQIANIRQSALHHITAWDTNPRSNNQFHCHYKSDVDKSPANFKLISSPIESSPSTLGGSTSKPIFNCSFVRSALPMPRI